MKSKSLAVILVLSMFFLIPGCAPKPPTCPTDELQAVSLLAPADEGQGISLTPTLSWEYPTSPSGCLPEKYYVMLRVGPFFKDDLGGDTTGPVASWTPAVPLQPGTEYMWSIQPMVGGVPVSYLELSYDTFRFITGPTCAADAFVAPNLLYPANGAVITDSWPELVWDYPQDCTPEEYLINLSTTADFSDTSLGDWTTTGSQYPRWLVWPPLDDCKTYYWKARALNGSTPGPASSAFSFRLDETGACQPTIIGGLIFHVQSNASCRFGPGVMYDNLTFVAVGDTLAVEAQNNDGTWFYGLASDNIMCWVAVSDGTLSGDATGLPVRAALPTPTFTPPPSVFRLTQNANCRFGPGSAYEHLVDLLAGAVVPVEARNESGTWLFVSPANGPQCWVAASNGTLSGDPAQLPTRGAPPTPTLIPFVPTEVSCSQYTTLETCEAHGCEWHYPSGATGCH